MLKQTFTYIDYNGNERTEDHYLKLTKAEVMESEMGMVEYAVICHDLKHASTLFRSLRTWFCETHVSNCFSRRVFCGFLMELRDMRITILFTSEAYFEIARRGFHGTVVSEYDVERFLDEHRK